MNIADSLFRIAKSLPDAPAVSTGLDLNYSFGQLAETAGRLARHLREKCGLQNGDRVALAMTNTAAFFPIAYGVWQAGLCLVPTNPRLHRREFAYIFENSGARLCFASPDMLSTVAGLNTEIANLEAIVSTDELDDILADQSWPIESCAPEDPCWIFYTSGTTGRPKGATLSHRNLTFMAQAYYADMDRVDVGDTMLHAAALSHGAGLYALPHLAQGGHQVICDGSFDPKEICDLIERLPQVSFFAAPTMVTRLVAYVEETRADTANLRTIHYGGGPMYVADLERALSVLGPKLAQLYGQGEAPMTISVLPKSWHERAAREGFLGSCGIPRTFVEVRIVDADDKDVPTGEIGEIITRSDCVMAGYWNMPEATAAALKGGWLHTGDLGSMDERGVLTLRDRSKDMIISGGSNVYPREVEEVLLRHPAVVEVAVVGRPHVDWVEEVVACVVTHTDHAVSSEELDQLCLENIGRYKRPRKYFFMQSLPKNNYGKVLKTSLRETVAAKADAEA
ncbi:MAG TPA: AMP-binding protein [Rhizobiaceae bacterium]|nr:AMP-binding protein [Rhizobiaceae bacterium]